MRGGMHDPSTQIPGLSRAKSFTGFCSQRYHRQCSLGMAGFKHPPMMDANAKHVAVVQQCLGA